MNEIQWNIYQGIVEETLGTVTMIERAGLDGIHIKVGLCEWVIEPNGKVIQIGPQFICDRCIHKFTPKVKPDE